MWLRKRMYAGILAAVVAVASMQLPAGTVYARETIVLSDGMEITEEKAQPVENGAGAVSEKASQQGDGEQLGESGDSNESEQPGDSGVQPGEVDDSNGSEQPGDGEVQPGEADDSDGSEQPGNGGEQPGESDGSNGSEQPGDDGGQPGEPGGSNESEQPGDGGEQPGDGSEQPDDGDRTEEPDDGGNTPAEPGETDENDGESGSTDGSGEETGEQENPADEMQEQVSGNDIPGSMISDTLPEEGDGRGIMAVGEALNLENLSAEYIALDGSWISSTAQGRPKVLIFYSNTCGNSQGTIQRISRKIGDFAGVDIYAIETTGKTKEEVEAFQAQYGCKEIVFSYDIGTLNQRSMWDYVYASGVGNLSSDGKVYITWPVIAYIDADDRLQYATTAAQTAEGILSNLNQYCGFGTGDEDRYTITYVLGGGTNSEENPSYYTSETDTIILKDAVKTGQPFEGWYKDPIYSARVREIVKGSTGDITLYAKWGAASASEIPEIDMTPAEGNVVMGFSGAYYTESVDKILDRLNKIRWEACTQGVLHPATRKPMTEADYVPLQWSSDLEAIARLRAAEATIENGHTRPNDKSCFSISTSNGEQSYAENLAWNYSGLMAGIEQWYKEKEDWVNQTAGKVTGHYTSIIYPEYRSVGVGAFRLSSGGWYAVAQQFSYKDTLDAYKNPSQGKCIQNIEVQGSKVTECKFGGDMAAYLREGATYQIPVDVTVQYDDYYDKAKEYSGSYQAGGTWRSSDESVAVVDDGGMLRAIGKGTTEISLEIDPENGKSAISTVFTVYGRDENPITVQRPDVTTYKVGQKLDVTGGKVTYVPSSGESIVTKELTPEMLSGFDSSKPGICTVNVSCGGYVTDFDTLIVEEPALSADYGQRLDQVALPACDHGTYRWQDGTTVLDQVGTRIFTAEFTPADQGKFQKLTDIQVKVTTQMMLGEETEVAFKSNTFVYNGAEQEPKVVVFAGNTVLTEGEDYELSYEDNKDAGTAAVTVQGIEHYHGSIRRTFEIQPAPVVIRAKDTTILVGGKIPAYDGYAYEVSGLMKGDKLIENPIFSCAAAGTDKTGCYDIIPGGADAGPNYTISYEKGRLIVANEYVSCTVTFDVQGHGTAPDDQVGIRVGDMVKRPADPSAEDYRFDGWYRDAACTKEWKFDTDIVQADMTLYAKWLYDAGRQDGFAMQEIADMYYTGKACKPAVSVYDGPTLLKAGRDYQIRYYNNVNANKDNMRKQGNGVGAFFKEELPYVEITGKGNYTEKVKVNFNILPVMIGDGGKDAAAGVTVKATDQLVKATKVQKPFTSIKYGKTMRKDIDYTLSLVVENGRDQSGRNLAVGKELEGAVIPAGYEGEFKLTIQGIGNYTGSISKPVYVADKAHLIKNARITLGRNLKNISFDGKAIELRAAENDSADVFTVKYGRESLRYNKDYRVRYRNNDRVGKAELTIIGMGEYVGEKTVTFNITGRSFTSRTVDIEGIEDKVYTGTALTQNDAFVIYGKGTEDERALVYGTDYTISYAKNVNAGTAVMTFKGTEQAGYRGSFKQTFKIAAADITQTEQAAEMKDMSVSYSRAGVMPGSEVVLTNGAGIRLINGKDYTLRYKNNKAVADRSDEEPPTIVVKGKGNYTGELPVYFSIVKKELTADDITIKTSSVAYKENKEADYAYKPSVKVLDGKKQLRAGVDYEITYVNNTQAAYEAYLQDSGRIGQNAASGNEAERGGGAGGPQAVITQKADSSYTQREPLIVPLTIYRNKLTKSNLTVEIAESVYTGTTVTPKVTVYYQGKDGGSRILLTEGMDYSLTYGNNIASGKNKGSVKIGGIGPDYGGDVTVKFNIGKKVIAY